MQLTNLDLLKFETSYCSCWDKNCEIMGGCSPKKNQKKTSRYTKIGKLALVYFGFFLVFLNFQISIGFFWFFLVFFGIGFGQNSKLETGYFGFFWFFWLFLVFFGIGLGQHSKLETGFLGSVGFFWFFFGFFWFFFGIFWFFLVFKFRVRISSQKNQKKPKKTKKNQKTQKNQKKPVATPKLVNWLGFFWLFLVFFFGFLVFWGEHPPNNC